MFRIHDRLCRTLGRYRTLSIAGSWFFTVLSVLFLLGVLASGARSTALHEVMAQGEVHRTWGLSYSGWGGIALAIFQLLLVLSAAVLTLTPTPWPRVAGHAALSAWALLWGINLASLAAIAPGLETLARAGIMSLLAAATVVRAILEIAPRRPSIPTAPQIAPEPRVMACTSQSGGHPEDAGPLHAPVAPFFAAPHGETSHEKAAAALPPRSASHEASHLVSRTKAASSILQKSVRNCRQWTMHGADKVSRSAAGLIARGARAVADRAGRFAHRTSEAT